MDEQPHLTQTAGSTQPGRRDQATLPRLHLEAGLVVFLALVLAVFVAVHHYLDARFDFGVFYYAAHMVMDGARQALYDAGAQHVFQARFHRPPAMLFRNPPFALLPMLPLAALPMLAAFAVWTAICFALLYVSLKVLEIETAVVFGNWPLLLSLAYVPVMASFLHGQFSLVILASYVFAYAEWRAGRRFWGGAILSIATLKVQLVLGFVAVLLLKRKGRELGGFVCGCAALLGVSALIAGLPAVLSYPAFLLHGEGNLANEFANMANWHGLLYLLHIDRPWLEIALSIVTIVWAAHAWKDLDRGFAAAMLAAMLVSYHFNPQDLALTLAPFYLAVKTGILPRQRVPLVVMLALFVTMMMVVAYAPLSLLALPIAAALWQFGRDATIAESAVDVVSNESA
jgi:hypothetical protein